MKSKPKETQPASPFSFRAKIGEAMTRDNEKRRYPPVERRAATRGGRGKRTAVTDAPVIAEIEKEKKPVETFGMQTKKVISTDFLGILQTMAKKSVEGSLAHAKYLFEIGGVKEEIQREAQARREPTLADLLLAEVKRQRASEAHSEDAATDIESDSTAESEEEADGNSGARGE